MGTTPNGLPYPEPTDDLRDGAGAIQALAEALDAPTATTLEGPNGNLQSLSVSLERVGAVVMFYAALQPGSVASGTEIGTVPEGFRPASNRNVALVANTATLYNAFLQLSAAGSVKLYMYGGPPATTYLRGGLSWASA